MNNHILTPDTQAILLLCGHLGMSANTEHQPLTPTEYNKLAQWLRHMDMCPADLLQPESLTSLRENLTFPLDHKHIEALISRGTALALAVESWTNKGLWILSRSDQHYPERLKNQLGHTAPPLLYGAGNIDLLSQGGLAIVGSRDVDKDGLSFTRHIATLCAQQNIPVVSGGARGVDSEAMVAALQAGGQVIGVLADSLAKAAVSGKYRDALRESRLVLASPYDPSIGFHVGNAMARNKHIYALGEWALVISCTYNKGGTWAGAVENLKHALVPLFVRSGEGVPEGNYKLVALGAIACKSDTLIEQTSVREWLSTHMQTSSEVTQETHADVPEHHLPSQPSSVPFHDLFSIVWPYIEAQLNTARTAKELTGVFKDIRLDQMKSWLQRAEKLGKVQSLSDARYIVSSQQQRQLMIE